MKYSYSEVPNVYLEQYDYEYDKDSNVVKETVKNNYAGNVRDITTTYEYDKLDRLVKSVEVNNLTGEEAVAAYEYDKVSNRTKKTVNGVVTTYTYNKLDQMVKSVETEGTNSYTTTYEYDARGMVHGICTDIVQGILLSMWIRVDIM